MLRANLHLKAWYSSTVEFLTTLSPTLSSSESTPAFGEEIRSRTSSLVTEEARSPVMPDEEGYSDIRYRQRNGHAHTEEARGSSNRADAGSQLAVARLELVKMEDKCRRLEEAVKITRKVLREKELEISKLKGGENSRPISFTCEERALEHISEAYFSQIDGWSGAQVLQATHDLNTEILQFSAALTELCVFDGLGETDERGVDVSRCLEDTEARLGTSISQLLHQRDHRDDPILVQLALQGAVVSCITRTAAAFCPGLSTKHQGILTQIHREMYFTVPQPTSSKWRSLTHQQIYFMYPYLLEYSIKELAETIYRWCADILHISHCRLGRDGKKLKDAIKAQFSATVTRISTATFTLRRIIKEEIMSTNFELVSVDGGAAFQPEHMANALGEYGQSQGAVVVTSELGLRCATRIVRAVPGEETEVKRVLLPPKVVLDSAINILLDVT